jgi:hypothetical protein
LQRPETRSELLLSRWPQLVTKLGPELCFDSVA